MNEYPENTPNSSEEEHSSDYNQRQQELQLYEEELRLKEEERRLRQGRRSLMVSRLIRGMYFLVGALITLLVLRFLLKLSGANPANFFAQVIYGFSEPFVSPFTNLFTDFLFNGTNTVEINTIAAIFIYGLLGVLSERFITIIGGE